MKAPGESWPEYLEEGIKRMEGTHPEPPWAGKKWFAEANWVFEDCIAQNEDLTVQLEACYRRAECAHYQHDEIGKERWFNWVDQRLQRKTVPVTTKIRCLLLKSSLLLKIEDRHAALYALSEAFEICPTQEHTLHGEIAYRIGCLRTNQHAAASWFRQAVKNYSAVVNPDSSILRALAQACSRTGVSLQRTDGYRSPEALTHLRRAEKLFTTQVHDHHLQANHWFNRFAVAAWYCRPQAVWFLLRAAFAAASSRWQKSST